MMIPAAMEMPIPLAGTFCVPFSIFRYAMPLSTIATTISTIAEEDKQRLAFRLAEVVDQRAQHERQSDTYRKGYRQSADRDGGRQQDVGGVEHDAAQKGAAEAVPVGLSQIGHRACVPRFRCCRA